MDWLLYDNGLRHERVNVGYQGETNGVQKRWDLKCFKTTILFPSQEKSHLASTSKFLTPAKLVY